MSEPLGEPFSLPVGWIGLEEQAAVFGNVFMIQASMDDVILNIGHATPPILPANLSVEERREIVASVGMIPARTVVRIALNRQRLLDLQTAANDAVRQMREQDARAGQHD